MPSTRAYVASRWQLRRRTAGSRLSDSVHGVGTADHSPRYVVAFRASLGLRVLPAECGRDVEPLWSGTNYLHASGQHHSIHQVAAVCRLRERACRNDPAARLRNPTVAGSGTVTTIALRMALESPAMAVTEILMLPLR